MEKGLKKQSARRRRKRNVEPTSDNEILTPDDVDNIMEELLEAQDQSYVFGLKLNLPPRVLDDIHKTYLMPRDRLHQVLQKFTNLVKPRATWRIIINALENPAVNLKRLAKILEAAHFPSSTSTHEAMTPSSNSCEISSTPSFGSRETSSTPSSAAILLACKPTLPELLNLKSSSDQTIRIIQQIGTHYSQLGLLLLDDKTGSITSAIVNQFHSKADAINQEILSRWLQGQGKQPVNWFTLIRVLRDMQLLELAKMIQKCLIEVQVQENNEWQQQLKTLKQRLHTKEESIRQLQQVIRQKETEKNELLQAMDKELAQAQQHLKQQRKEEQSSRRDIDDLQKLLLSSEELVDAFQKALQERDLELETLRPKADDNELTQAQEEVIQLREQISELHDTKMDICALLESIGTQVANFHHKYTVFSTKVSGPGQQSATANHPTHVVVELTDSGNRPYPVQQNITAELVPISKATPTRPSRELPIVIGTVTVTSPSQYKVSYTAVNRGQYKLHIRINDKEIEGSPFNTTIYPDPNQLAHPVKVICGLTTPYSIVFTSHGKMIISEKVDNRISILDTEGKRVDKFETHGDSSKQILVPQGIAIDDDDNVYVSSQFKLQKFTSSGEFIDCVGQEGSNEKEFNDPYGITLHDNQLYVCDCSNHRIQVFELDLKYVRSIGSCGKGKGQFRKPYDVKFDKDHNMYVAEYKGGRVQVLDKNGQFIRMFDKNEKLEDWQPSALHIIDKFVYVSDWNGGHIIVYETSGRFVTSFGGWGHKRGKFLNPYCINTYKDQIYICDRENGRIQIF